MEASLFFTTHIKNFDTLRFREFYLRAWMNRNFIYGLYVAL